MPKMGDAMEQGRIVQWRKKVGDPVAAGDVVAEIETDKSNVEIEAEEAGIAAKSIAVPEGESAPVGSVIALIGAGAAAPRRRRPRRGAPVTPRARPPMPLRGRAPASRPRRRATAPRRPPSRPRPKSRPRRRRSPGGNRSPGNPPGPPRRARPGAASCARRLQAV